MSALVLDAGALIAVDRNDRKTIALLAAARSGGLAFRTNANVVAQAWRDDRGRQVLLGQFLRSTHVASVDEATGRQAGVLMAKAGTKDVVDATLVLLATTGDTIVTTDRSDVAVLLSERGISVQVVDC